MWLFSSAALLTGSIAAFGVASASQLLLLFVAGSALSAWFVLDQRRGDPSLIPPSLAGSRQFRAGILTCFLFFLDNLSFYVTVTLYVSSVFDLSALSLGLAFVPLGLAFVLDARVGAFRAHRVAALAVREGVSLQALSLAAFAAFAATGLAPPPFVATTALLAAICGAALLCARRL